LFFSSKQLPNAPITAPTGKLPFNTKHSDDFFFAEAAYTHPSRVMDPTKALLFIMPALFNAAVAAMFKGT
jgi:hypothetical protein